MASSPGTASLCFPSRHNLDFAYVGVYSGHLWISEKGGTLGCALPVLVLPHCSVFLARRVDGWVLSRSIL